jgi:ferrous iron transport protein B
VVIWALGYFPKNTDLEKKFDDQIAPLEYAASIYSDDPEREVTEEESLLHQQIKQLEHEKQSQLQEQSFIGRIGHFIEPVIAPLGYDWKIGVSLVAGSAAKEVVISTLGVLYQTPEADQEGLVQKLQEATYESGEKEGQKVFTPLVAFSLMIFVLIYFPCIAVIAAIKKESGRWKWSAFLAGYTTVLAWLAAFAVFQIGSLMGF